MNLLKAITENPMIKKKVIGLFIEKFKELNTDSIVITLKENNEFDFKPLTKSEIIVPKERYDFLVLFFDKHKNLLNGTK